MASYQEIDTRLAVLEDMLQFVMSNFRMTAVVSSGIVGPDGVEVPGKKFQGNLLEFYLLSKAENLPVVGQNESDAPPSEEVNG